MSHEYVRVRLDKNDCAPDADMDSRREAIDHAAAEGKRHAGWASVVQGPTGNTVELGLIFEVA